MHEAPHDADGYYTCDCGRDRNGDPLNRRSIMHAHAASLTEPELDVQNQLRAMRDYIRSQYGIRRQGRGESGWYCHGGHLTRRDGDQDGR
jgi:hypothetical protein